MTQRAVYLLLVVVLQACASPGPRRASSTPLSERGAPDPESVPAAGASDDPEIERRIEEESAELREVHEAEVHARADAGRGDPGGAPSPRPGDPVPGVPHLPEVGHDLRQLRAEYDIPIDVNEEVAKYVRVFQSAEVRPHFVRWLSRYERYGRRFREILREEGLPEDTVYLAMIESGFANLATSRAKAVGAWQFIAETGERFGLRQDFWVDERRDPEKAARAAAAFLGELHRRFGDWRLAWAAYNAGPGRITRAISMGHRGFWDMARARRALPAETRAYVPKLMAAAIIAKHRGEFGFVEGELEPERWIEREEVVIPRTTELSFVAEAAQVSVEALLDLNPELRRTCTPPRPYALKLPRESARAFAENWPRASEEAARTAVARHVVRRGETLRAIARAYDVPPETLARLNRLGRWRLRVGAVLAIPLGSVPRRHAEALARRARPASARVRVRSGDTLWSIARRFGVTVQELARRNGIRDPERHLLRVGRVLSVRRGRPAAALRAARASGAGHSSRRHSAEGPKTRTVRVRRGDSLWSLAVRFGVTVRDLARWNGIRRPNRHVLRAGQVLVVRWSPPGRRAAVPDPT